MTAIDRFAGKVFDIVVELAPWLLLGALAVGLLRVLLPARLIAAMDGPPGSPTAVVLAPQLDPMAILATGGMLGWWFVGAKLIGAAFIAGVGGLLGRAAAQVQNDEAPAPRRTRSARAVVEAALSGLDPILGWVVLSVFVAAIIGTFAPHETVLPPGAVGTSLAYIIAVGIAVPLHISASASVPVAGALIGAGFPPGAALVLLLLGPSTNTAALAALQGRHGARGLVVAVLGLTTLSVAAGLGVDAWLPEVLPSCCAPEAVHVQADAPVVKVAAAGLLLLLIAARFALIAQHAFRRPQR